MSYDGPYKMSVSRLDEVRSVINLLDRNIIISYRCTVCTFESTQWIITAQHIIKEHPEVLDNESND